MYKQKIEKILCKCPRLYAAITRTLRSKNYEKMFYLNQIRKGDIVFEFGANRGYFTNLYTNIVGKDGHVYAFEAVKSTFESTSKALRPAYIPNLTFENKAVGNINTTTEICIPDDADGQASLANQNAGCWQDASIRQEECQMIRIADYIMDKGIDRIDFLKADIEGAELLAFQGMSTYLREFSPKLLVEINSAWTSAFEYKPIDLISYLKDQGYLSFYEVSNTLKYLSKDQLEDENIFSNGGMNVFCKL